LILLELCCNFKTYHEKNQTFQQLRQNQLTPQGLLNYKVMKPEADVILSLTHTKPEKRLSA
jgi:hypothetical protein